MVVIVSFGSFLENGKKLAQKNSHKKTRAKNVVQKNSCKKLAQNNSHKKLAQKTGTKKNGTKKLVQKNWHKKTHTKKLAQKTRTKKPARELNDLFGLELFTKVHGHQFHREELLIYCHEGFIINTKLVVNSETISFCAARGV